MLARVITGSSLRLLLSLLPKKKLKKKFHFYGNFLAGLDNVSSRRRRRTEKERVGRVLGAVECPRDADKVIHHKHDEVMFSGCYCSCISRVSGVVLYQ